MTTNKDEQAIRFACNRIARASLAKAADAMEQLLVALYQMHPDDQHILTDHFPDSLPTVRRMRDGMKKWREAVEDAETKKVVDP